MNVDYIDWKQMTQDVVKRSIDEDFVTMDSAALRGIPQTPFKVDVTTIILCEQGRIEGNISMERFEASAPSLVVVLADRIMEMESVSDDFRGQVLIMSNRFTDNLLFDVKDRLPLTVSVENRPCQPLNKEALESLQNYFSMMKKAIEVKENPYRLEVARHLMLAFMFGVRHYFHAEAPVPKTHNEQVVHDSLAYVKQHYRRERLLQFYADKLCLTSKHVSKVVRQVTGKSPNDWIDSYVILETKALLKSTDMTVQQICLSLNFDNTSFFAKYFKRKVEISPKEYRNRR